MAKDLFSRQALSYARFRPGYPTELIEYIMSFVQAKEKAWDCATGNGQSAALLSGFFKKVEASDISAAQLENAVQKNNITYHLFPAEKTSFAENSFDLITVAQAYHWLNFENFRKEALRVARPDCVIAVWGYGLLTTADKNIDQLISHFYRDIVGPFWDEERKYIDENYSTVPFDFDRLPAKKFSMKYSWTKQQLQGYLQSWSAVQNYRKKNNTDPAALIENDLDLLWPSDQKLTVVFPVFLLMGRIDKNLPETEVR